VVVQQGRLTPTDTTKDLANFYNDVVVSRVSDVDRIIHNGTQFARLVMRRPKAINAYRGSSGAPDTLTSTPEYIDRLFTANPVTGANLIVVDFGGIPVFPTDIVVYSTSALNDTVGNWAVAGGTDGTDAQFSNAQFISTINSVTTAFDVSTGQFRTTINIDPPPVDSDSTGLPFWRLRHTTAGEFNNVTEVEIITPLDNAVISYYDTDGSFASSFTFEQDDILDAAYDSINGVFYTIRFNGDTVGTISLNLGDDFSEAEAGAAAGTNGFNPARWTEDATNSQFLRSSEELRYNVATGDGQLETTFQLSGDLNIILDANPLSISSTASWLTMRALDTDKNTIMSEGVGYITSPTTSGVWFTHRIANLVNSTADCELREMRPLWHNTTSGTDSFVVTYNGTNWAVSGTLTGALTNASTGDIYTEADDSGTPLEFIISCTAAPSPGEQFTFDLVTDYSTKNPTTTGILGIFRSGTTFSTAQVLGVTHPSATVSSGVVTVELYGNTSTSVNVRADNFTINEGTGVFPSIPVFTVEKTDNEGAVIDPPLISAFDVIGDPSKTFNSFLDGRVQIAAASSGTGLAHIYLKVDNRLLKYANNISLGSEDGSSALVDTTDQISAAGTHSFNWTHESGLISPTPFLTYLDYDDVLGIVHVKTIDKDTLLDNTTNKEVLLNISNYSDASNPFKIFYDQNDFDTLYYVDGTANLYAFNLDDRLSAFMALNADDVSLPAGTSQQTFVRAEVINAWGETLDGKDVTFSVTAGDGAVSPASDTTVSGGQAETQFTVGSTVGVSTVTAVVTES